MVVTPLLRDFPSPCAPPQFLKFILCRLMRMFCVSPPVARTPDDLKIVFVLEIYFEIPDRHGLGQTTCRLSPAKDHPVKIIMPTLG